MGLPGAKADSTGVIVIAGGSFVGVDDGSRDGITVEVGRGVDDDSRVGMAVAVGAIVGATAQAFRPSRRDKTREGIYRNFLMNTLSGICMSSRGIYAQYSIDTLKCRHPTELDAIKDD